MSEHWLNITSLELKRTREDRECGLFEARKMLLREKMLERLASDECSQDDLKTMVKVLIEHMR